MVILIFLGCNDTPSLEIRKSTQVNSVVRIEGKIDPPESMLSVSSIGECGRSAYRDIEVDEGGRFTLHVPLSFIDEMEFLLSTPQGGHLSQTLRLANNGRIREKRGDECGYMHVRESDEDRPMLFVVEESCYDIGYKYGSCVSRSHLNIPCKVGTNVSIPFRCRDTIETKKGIQAGRI